MREYLTKQEATELLGKSLSHLYKRIANGEISFIAHPSNSREKILLASDVYRIKAEEDKANKKRVEEFGIKLDILDAVSSYGIPIKELYIYEDKAKEVATLPPERRREALRELIHGIVEKHRENYKEAGYE